MNINYYQPKKTNEKARQLLNDAGKIIQEYLKNVEILKKELLPYGIRPHNYPLYKLWIRQAGKPPRYILLDTYYQGRYGPEIIKDLPIGGVVSLVINQGEKHQFFRRLWTA